MTPDRYRAWRSAGRRSAGIAGLLALGSCGASSPGDRSAPPAESAARYDVVISGGRIMDGTGNPWFYGDLAIRAGRIARIAPPGLLAAAAATQRIDASGKIVSPGFIDLDSQSMSAFTFGDGRVVSMVTQGVTTAMVGEGESIAPINDRRKAAFQDPGSPYAAVAESLAKRLANPHGFRRWLDLMEGRGLAENVGAFIGAAAVRVYAKGEAEGPPSAAELDTMQAVVREAMDDGAFGIASALIYPPGSYATTEELIAEAGAAGARGGIYITHLRSEADRLLEAIDEAFRIGREARIPVEIYHFKVSGERNQPKLAFAIAKIDSARERGADVGANMYLYTAGWTGLANCAPPWAAADGKLLPNLRDPAARARIREAMTHPDPGSEGLCLLAGPDGIQLSGLERPEHRQWEGKRLSSVAAARRASWFDAWADLVLAEPSANMVVYLTREANLPIELRQPWMKINTDANGVDPDSVGATKFHPRSYGNYPRLFGRYVREQRVVSWEDAVRKSSSAVADRLSIRDRGTLREGAWADVVIFDPDTIADRATFEDPNRLSVGVEHVWVNGVAVLERGKPTDARPGRALHGPGFRGPPSPTGPAR